jgi:hypothetical protein
MTLGFPTIQTKILACIPIDRYKKISTIYIKDTCLQIPLAATQDLQSRGLGNSLAARSLRDDPQAGKNNTKINKSNKTPSRRISII